MTDTPSNTPEPGIDFDKFIELCGTFYNGVECPVCHNPKPDYGVTAGAANKDGNTVYLGLTRTSQQGSTYIGGSLPMIVITCNHCGFTRLHDVNALQKKWGDQEKAAS